MMSKPNLLTDPTRLTALRAIGPLAHTGVPVSHGICLSCESKLEADG